MTSRIETNNVVERLGAWSNDPDDEPPIVLMMDAKAAILALSDRIAVLTQALERIAASRLEDPTTLHPSSCAQIAKDALTQGGER